MEATEEYKGFVIVIGTTRLIDCWVSLHKKDQELKEGHLICLHDKQDCLNDDIVLIDDIVVFLSYWKHTNVHLNETQSLII